MKKRTIFFLITLIIGLQSNSFAFPFFHGHYGKNWQVSRNKRNIKINKRHIANKKKKININKRNILKERSQRKTGDKKIDKKLNQINKKQTRWNRKQDAKINNNITNINTNKANIKNNAKNIQDLNNRINDLEETQQIVGLKARVFDSKKWQVNLFADYSVNRSMVDRTGVRFTYKFGSSFEEREINKLKKIIEKYYE